MDGHILRLFHVCMYYIAISRDIPYPLSHIPYPLSYIPYPLSLDIANNIGRPYPTPLPIKCIKVLDPCFNSIYVISPTCVMDG